MRLLNGPRSTEPGADIVVSLTPVEVHVINQAMKLNPYRTISGSVDKELAFTFTSLASRMGLPE